MPVKKTLARLRGACLSCRTQVLPIAPFDWPVCIYCLSNAMLLPDVRHMPDERYGF